MQNVYTMHMLSVLLFDTDINVFCAIQCKSQHEVVHGNIEKVMRWHE